MSLFEKLFGKKKKVEIPSPAPEVQKKNQSLAYPKKFEEFLNSNKGKAIRFSLPDDDYILLESITKEMDDISDLMENAYMTSLEMSHHAKWKDKRGLPFARNVHGDRTKYLLFMEKSGQELTDQVYFMDMDSYVSSIEITPLIHLYGSKPISLKQLFEKLQLPPRIALWEESVEHHLRDNTNGQAIGLSVEQHAVNYIFEDTKETLARIDYQFSLSTKDKVLFSNVGYEFSDSNLELTITEYNYYRTFYYKYYSLIDALIRTKEFAVKKGVVSEEEFLALLNLDKLKEITAHRFKSVNTEYP